MGKITHVLVISKNKMKITPSIWLIFTILFISFSVYHFFKLTHSFPRFDWEVHEGLDSEFYNGTAIENNINLKKFVAQWNKYIDEQNISSFWINLIAAITYLISAFMAAVSMSKEQRNKKITKH